MHIPNGLIRVQRIGIQAPIHGTSFTYGRTISTTTDEGQRQEYNTGGQRRKALLLRVQHPKAANLLWATHLHLRARRILLPPWLWICLLSWQRLSETNQVFYF